MLIIDDGSVKEINDVQPRNTSLPMLVIDDGSVTEVSDVQR